MLPYDTCRRRSIRINNVIGSVARILSVSELWWSKDEINESEPYGKLVVISLSVISIMPSCMSFRVHKRDIVNNIQVFQQYGTYEAIKITAGDKSIHIC